MHVDDGTLLSTLCSTYIWMDGQVTSGKRNDLCQIASA